MGDRIINIRDLAVEILLCWRWLFLWMFFWGIVFGTLHFCGFLQSEEIAAAEHLQKISLSELEEEMAQKELAEVEQVLLKEDYLEEWQSYIQNSVLMNLDASQAYQGKLIYAVTTNKIETDLTGTYVNLLTSTQMYQFVADRIDGFTASDIQESITVANPGTASGQKNASFNISFLGKTKESCDMISEAIQSYMVKLHRLCADIYGSHKTVLLQDYKSPLNTTEILQKQIDLQGKFVSLQTELAELKDAFSEREKRYYQLRTEKKAREASSSTGEASGTYQREAAWKKAAWADLRESMKYAAWGMFFSLLLFISVIFFRYILDDRVRYTDNWAQIYQISPLGHIPAARNPRTLFQRIDKKIYLMRDRGRYTPSPGEGMRMAEAAIRMGCQKKQITGICAVSCRKSPKLISKIQGKIRKSLKAAGIELQVADNILYSAESLNRLDGVHTVFLMEKARLVFYQEIWEELEILRRQQIEVLGIVIVE